MIWKFLQPGVDAEMLGLIPFMLDEADPRPAAQQFDSAYGHGGGWHPFSGFVMAPNGELRYPGDPPMKPLAETNLRDEVIRFYEHAWVVIIKLDGTFEACRMD